MTKYFSDFLRILHERCVFAIILATICTLPYGAGAEENISKAILQRGIYTFDDNGVEAGMETDECAVQRTYCTRNFSGNGVWAEYFTAVCAPENRNKCVCKADVVYPIVEGSHVAKEINQALKKVAAGYACQPYLEMTELKYEIPFNEAHVISIVFNGYGLGTGGQGSCHSQIITMTFNSKTGHIYTLKEVLDSLREADIKNSIINYFSLYFSSNKGAIKNLKQDLNEKFWNLGFYIKNRQLFIDLDDYILSCADGPSFPIPIPRKFIINTEILGLMR